MSFLFENSLTIWDTWLPLANCKLQEQKQNPLRYCGFSKTSPKISFLLGCVPSHDVSFRGLLELLHSWTRNSIVETPPNLCWMIKNTESNKAEKPSHLPDSTGTAASKWTIDIQIWRFQNQDGICSFTRARWWRVKVNRFLFVFTSRGGATVCYNTQEMPGLRLVSSPVKALSEEITSQNTDRSASAEIDIEPEEIKQDVLQGGAYAYWGLI